MSPRWKGDCGGKKQLWFPANYVEEISPSAAEPDRGVSKHARARADAHKNTQWIGFTITFVETHKFISCVMATSEGNVWKGGL